LCICLTQAFGVWLSIIIILYIIIILVCFLVIGNSKFRTKANLTVLFKCFNRYIIILAIHGGIVGLALIEAIGSIGIIQILVRLPAILESQMVSVERVIEYTCLPQEDALQSNTGTM